jgi:long-subunit fatty acid transport protein
MMNRLLLLYVLLILSSLTLTAQETDFGLWYEVNAEYDIVKGLRFDFEANVRTDQNASKIEKFYFEPGLRYKFNDYFAAGIYYRFMEQRETIDKSEGIYEFHPRHRWYLQLKGSLPVNRFTLSARYRFQEQFKTYIEDPEDEIPVWAHRVRLELNYDIKGLPLEPYANVEMASELFTSNDIMIEKWRYIVGADYTVNKKHTFGLEYIYNVSKDSKPAYMNSIGLKYKIKL